MFSTSQAWGGGGGGGQHMPHVNSYLVGIALCQQVRLVYVVAHQLGFDCGHGGMRFSDPPSVSSHLFWCWNLIVLVYVCVCGWVGARYHMLSRADWNPPPAS
jgi:hypothetical protein